MRPETYKDCVLLDGTDSPIREAFGFNRCPKDSLHLLASGEPDGNAAIGIWSDPERVRDHERASLGHCRRMGQACSDEGATAQRRDSLTHSLARCTITESGQGFSVPRLQAGALWQVIAIVLSSPCPVSASSLAKRFHLDYGLVKRVVRELIRWKSSSAHLGSRFSQITPDGDPRVPSKRDGITGSLGTPVLSKGWFQ
jgi:hypothetical protein